MNVGKLRDRVNILEKVDDEAVENLDGAASYNTVKSVYGYKIKRLDKESVSLSAIHNQTRVDFIMRVQELSVFNLIESAGVKYAIVGFETLKDDSNFMLVATLMMR